MSTSNNSDLRTLRGQCHVGDKSFVGDTAATKMAKTVGVEKYYARIR